MTLTLGELCAGVGALGMALSEVIGCEPVWHAQFEPKTKQQYAAQILAHHHPGVPNHGDITTLDYAGVQSVDIIAAGFPCQDISLAGRRVGLMPGTRSGVWSHVARAIGELRPSLVFIENVRSLTSVRAHSDVEHCPWCMGDGRDAVALRALGAVLGDLADLGFDAEWTCVRASDVGAPHQRARIFVLAWPSAADPAHDGRERQRRARRGGADLRTRISALVRDADGATGDQRRLPAPGQTPGGWARADAGGPGGIPPRWREFEAAVRRWELILGRAAPEPVDGGGRLSTVFVEWMMGLPEGWVTGVAGVPRNAQFAALGNAVVPMQAAYALRVLLARYASTV